MVYSGPGHYAAAEDLLDELDADRIEGDERRTGWAEAAG
jgi:hypothetical protein